MNIKFGVIADPQYADKDTNIALQRDYRGSLVKIKEAIAEFNSTDMDFVVAMGDLVDESLNDFQPVLDILKTSRHKVYFIPGNHDYIAVGGDGRKLAELWNEDSTFFSFQKNKYRFIFLDTNDGIISSIPFSRDIEIEYEQMNKKEVDEVEYSLTSKHSWNGFILDEQKEWLKKELDEAKNSKEKVIIFGHDMLYPQMSNMLQNNKEILSLLYGYTDTIIACFAGHEHAGAYGEWCSIPFVTLKAMVQNGCNPYSIVSINDSNIEITGFNNENSYNFKYIK